MRTTTASWAQVKCEGSPTLAPSSDLTLFSQAVQSAGPDGGGASQGEAEAVPGQGEADPCYAPGHQTEAAARSVTRCRSSLTSTLSPAGIQMVKRPTFEHSPVKRPRLHPPGNMSQTQYLEDEEEVEDDITEIREGDESGEYYDEYQDYDENMYQEDNTAHPPPAPPPTSGSQLMGLVCPQCRQMCKGVQALKEHMAVCKAGARPQAQQGGRELTEEPQESLCHICDKAFKNHRTLDNHLKKQHGVSGSRTEVRGRGRGRPKKSPAMSDWGGEGGYEGGYAEPGVSQPLHRGRPVGQVAPQRVSEAVPVPVPVSRPGQPAAPAVRGMRGRGLPRGGLSR